MDTYIVRIYRRLKGKPEEVVGISEHVETGNKLRFKGLRELCGIIVKPESKSKRDMKKRLDSCAEEPENEHPA